MLADNQGHINTIEFPYFMCCLNINHGVFSLVRSLILSFLLISSLFRSVLLIFISIEAAPAAEKEKHDSPIRTACRDLLNGVY